LAQSYIEDSDLGFTTACEKDLFYYYTMNLLDPSKVRKLPSMKDQVRSDIIALFETFKSDLVILGDRTLGLKVGEVERAKDLGVANLIRLYCIFRSDSQESIFMFHTDWCAGHTAPYESYDELLGIRHEKSLPYSTHGVSVNERRHLDILNAIRAIGSPEDGNKMLPTIYYAKNTNFDHSIGMTPYRALFGRDAFGTQDIATLGLLLKDFESFEELTPQQLAKTMVDDANVVD
jgi:hypothetical protein